MTALWISAGPLDADGLAEAVAGAAKVFGLLSAPAAFRLCVVRGGEYDFGGEPALPLAQCYEARFFCEAWELRWVRDGAGGRAMRCAETAHGGPLGEAVAMSDVVGHIDQTYLIWGERAQPDGAPPGWGVVAEGRIGRLRVPAALSAATPRAALTAREYLRRYVDGNVAVADQRLTGIRAVRRGAHSQSER